MTDQDGSTVKLGKIDDEDPYIQLIDPHDESKGITLGFMNGDECHRAGRPNIVELRLVCSEQLAAKLIVEEYDICFYKMTLAVPCQDPRPCRFASSGASFDLQSLSRKQMDFRGQTTDSKFTMNFCAPSTTSAKCEASGQSICQFSLTQEFQAGLGAWKAPPLPAFGLIDDQHPNVGFEIIYPNGDPCHDSTSRTTTVRVFCDSQTTDQFTVKQNNATCTTTIDLRAPAGCPWMEKFRDSGKKIESS
jgi:hypothetical protein